MMKWLKKIHDFLIDKGKVKAELFWIKKVWYILLLILSSIYVYNNFEQLAEQCFICLFNGNSLIFILWIILLFMPLFDSIEGYGFKFNKEQDELDKEIKDLGNRVQNQENYANMEELRSQFEDITKELKNE